MPGSGTYAPAAAVFDQVGSEEHVQGVAHRGQADLVLCGDGAWVDALPGQIGAGPETAADFFEQDLALWLVTLPIRLPGFRNDFRDGIASFCRVSGIFQSNGQARAGMLAFRPANDPGVAAAATGCKSVTGTS